MKATIADEKSAKRRCGELMKEKDEEIDACTEAIADEKLPKTNYDELMKADTKEIDVCTKAIHEDKMTQDGKHGMEIERMKGDLSDTQQGMLEDKHFLEGTDEQCAAAALRESTAATAAAAKEKDDRKSAQCCFVWPSCNNPPFTKHLMKQRCQLPATSGSTFCSRHRQLLGKAERLYGCSRDDAIAMIAQTTAAATAAAGLRDRVSLSSLDEVTRLAVDECDSPEEFLCED